MPHRHDRRNKKSFVSDFRDEYDRQGRRKGVEEAEALHGQFCARRSIQNVRFLDKTNEIKFRVYTRAGEHRFDVPFLTVRVSGESMSKIGSHVGVGGEKGVALTGGRVLAVSSTGSISAFAIVATVVHRNQA